MAIPITTAPTALRHSHLLHAWLDASAVMSLPGGPELSEAIFAAITHCERLSVAVEGGLSFGRGAVA